MGRGIALGALATLAITIAGCGGSTTTVINSPSPSPSTTTVTTTAADSPPQPPVAALDSSSPLSSEGLGPVLVGMSVQKASEAAGVRLTPVGDVGSNSSCSYVETKDLGGVSFMVSSGEIARVDVKSPQIATLSGVRVGDPTDAITSAYGDSVSAKPNFYAKDLTDYTFTPQDRADKTRMIFTAGPTITLIRAGRLPEVEYVEGCS